MLAVMNAKSRPHPSVKVDAYGLQKLHRHTYPSQASLAILMTFSASGREFGGGLHIERAISTEQYVANCYTLYPSMYVSFCRPIG